jgi:hypothetical protein
MKKSILLFAVALGILTSCDPIKDEKDFDVTNLTPEQLLNGASFSQFADAACTEPKADGNWIKYNIPTVSSVYIFYTKPDGSEFKLASGASAGVFNFVPPRGSDSNQTVSFRYINQDGVETTADKQFTVEVASELEMPVRFLASNDYGKKIWKWDTTVADGGEVWGNMGYQPGDGKSVGTTGNGKWWGIATSEEFNNQLKHTEDGTNHGDGDLNAYMEFKDDGTVTCYDAEGNVVRADAFKVENWNPAGEWKVGDLVTKAILWPYQINWKDNGNEPIPGTYEIVYLTSSQMTLVYPDGGSQGAWGEASFWHFCSNTDINGMAAGYDKGKSWTWDPSITGAVWGNMGYLPGDGASVGTTGNGQWWGVTSTEEFNGQLKHSDDETNHGDGDLDAYMTFSTDGILKAYNAAGEEIRSSAYEFVKVDGSDWKVADLKTTSILWPYQINWKDNGFDPIPGTYEVVYMTNDKMTLVYPDGGSQGGWGEASFWHFKAKE